LYEPTETESRAPVELDGLASATAAAAESQPAGGPAAGTAQSRRRSTAAAGNREEPASDEEPGREATPFDPLLEPPRSDQRALDSARRQAAGSAADQLWTAEAFVAGTAAAAADDDEVL